MSRAVVAAWLASVWALLTAAAIAAGAPMSSSVIDAGLAVAVAAIALLAWRDRTQAVTR